VPRVIVLDTFPLSSTGKLDPPNGIPATTLDQCRRWIRDCVAAGNRVVAPAISYYEALRELERLNATRQIARLRAFCRADPDRYLPVTDAHLEYAAKLWAQARQAGTPTASVDALDGDAILAAQALSLGVPTTDLIVAATNVGHLSLFVPADLWTNIAP
jgi:predicted nucleic acid-binding protein